MLHLSLDGASTADVEIFILSLIHWKKSWRAFHCRLFFTTRNYFSSLKNSFLDNAKVHVWVPFCPITVSHASQLLLKNQWFCALSHLQDTKHTQTCTQNIPKRAHKTPPNVHSRHEKSFFGRRFFGMVAGGRTIKTSPPQKPP